jgi:hypothetical protein
MIWLSPWQYLCLVEQYLTLKTPKRSKTQKSDPGNFRFYTVTKWLHSYPLVLSSKKMRKASFIFSRVVDKIHDFKIDSPIHPPALPRFGIGRWNGCVHASMRM